MKHFFRGGRGMTFSLKPRGAQTFFLDKESMQRNQGVECSPKFGLRVLKSKNSPDRPGSNSFDFFTSSQSQFLTATHPKAVLAKGFKLTALLIIFCVLFSGLLVLPAFGQEAKGLNNAIPVRVGDKVPPEFWTKEHIVYKNGDTIRMTLEHLRGKPFILDFWATWCGTCIQRFKYNDSYQKELNSEIQFILVDSDLKNDNLERISKVLSDTSHFGGDHGQSIVFDAYLKQLFPHQAIPHYIWIDHTGRVRAISTFDFVTRDQLSILVDRSKGIWK
ncbi:TlpA family protein disulfide reductase [Sphingobacterium tabacisoli]|uniref:Redoxin family protein n=1 Tax=Sphingobacterium tabacisoli TaxID=2044855 RepID=A0ABW5L0P1_9SPHI|nr:TlpA family protein disulfide reductase [Sphingobacterium tabacisoli]